MQVPTVSGHQPTKSHHPGDQRRQVNQNLWICAAQPPPACDPLTQAQCGQRPRPPTASYKHSREPEKPWPPTLLVPSRYGLGLRADSPGKALQVGQPSKCCDPQDLFAAAAAATSISATEAVGRRLPYPSSLPVTFRASRHIARNARNELSVDLSRRRGASAFISIAPPVPVLSALVRLTQLLSLSTTPRRPFALNYEVLLTQELCRQIGPSCFSPKSSYQSTTPAEAPVLSTYLYGLRPGTTIRRFGD
ncbi:hypothetical protein CSUB01_01388 [Colletotrichum sublineola]|uniref:Uncharacterized protein n=1 Tax=Colletotrichum sublineola TaxID=1173701 RepID=A0A066XV70_COLSU|nr:hypothetical protein CSUB01_01388 [Colletotrichum sublineola]